MRNRICDKCNPDWEEILGYTPIFMLLPIFKKFFGKKFFINNRALFGHPYSGLCEECSIVLDAKAWQKFKVENPNYQEEVKKRKTLPNMTERVEKQFFQYQWLIVLLVIFVLPIYLYFLFR